MSRTNLYYPSGTSYPFINRPLLLTYRVLRSKYCYILRSPHWKSSYLQTALRTRMTKNVWDKIMKGIFHWSYVGWFCLWFIITYRHKFAASTIFTTLYNDILAYCALTNRKLRSYNFYNRFCPWPHGLRRGSAANRLLGLRVRFPLVARMSVSYMCSVLWGRVFCDGPISRPEETCQVWCVWVWSWSLDNKEALTH